MTITIGSATRSVQPEKEVYVTSESRESVWGQPAASYYQFRVDGERLYGEPYVQSGSQEIHPTTSSLMEEFRGWDELSDEALLSLEASIS